MVDAIVIGSGPNGLVAGAMLARAGLSVQMLEAAMEPGGAVRSVPLTLPGFMHDVGAAFFPFGRHSPAFLDLDLEGAGVVWKHAAIDSAHPARDGSVGVLARDLNRLASEMGPDGEVMAEVASRYQAVAADLLPLLLEPLPPMKRVFSVGPLPLMRLGAVALSSGRGFATRTFETEAARRILPALALHTDVGPDDAFGAIVGYMLAVTASHGGFQVPVGGAGQVTRALVRRFEEAGGQLELGCRAERVLTEGGRAIGVRTERGDELRARVVLADTAAPTLYLKLLAPQVVPSTVLEKMRSFRQGFGTFKVDWALTRPVPWISAACREAAVVHTGESLDDLARFTSDVRAGKLAPDPYLVIGQQSLLDPTRAPAGEHTLYAYTRVPSGLPYDRDQKLTYATEIEARIEQLAPGFRASILGRHISSPRDLEADNENLIGGDLGGGTADISNQLFLRPMFPYYRYRTPLGGLYLGSSYAHPGAGVHGMCGYNAAQAVLADLGAR